MHGFRARFALRSVAEYFCKSKWHHRGGGRHTGRLQICRTLAPTRGFSTNKHEPVFPGPFISHTDSNVGPDFWESGVESTTRFMQMQIVSALRVGERRRASDLLFSFGYGSHSLRADDFVDILNYCVQSPDPLFVMETWRLMEARDISLNFRCSFLMMQALCKGGHLEEAFNMMNFFGESRHLYTILPLCNTFLRACSKMRSMFHASNCLDLMEKQAVGKNEITYSELLKLAVMQKNLSAVHQIWEDYVKHYSMSILTLRKFIWSFTRMGDLMSAYKALQQMVFLAIRGTVSVNRRANGKFSSTRLDIPVPSNRDLQSTITDLEENKQSDSYIDSTLCIPDANSASMEQQIIFAIRNEKTKSAEGCLTGKKHTPVMKVLRWSFNDVIRASARNQNYDLAEQLILQMQDLGLQQSSHTYDGFVRAVVSQGGFNDGIELLKVMREKNLKPYDSTLATLSVSCSKALELDLAEALLNQISNCPYPHPYNTFFASCDKLNQPERAVPLLAKMKQMNLLPDIRTYELLFSVFGNVNAPYEEGNMLSQVDVAKRINAIERDMAKNGIQHSHLSMKNLLKALGQEGMLRELIQYFYVAEDLFIYRNPSVGTSMYNIALHSLVEAEEAIMAIQLFKRMMLRGCQPNAATYNIMIDCCSILKCFKSASLLISMMIRHGFYPETPTYTALIKIVLAEENFNEALSLLDQVRLDGFPLDVLLFNTILQKACDKGRIDVIEFIVECMNREKILPDPATCNYVFSAYVNSGFYSTGIEALQVLSIRMMSEDDNIFKENKILVDEFVLADNMDAESRIIQLFEHSEENLAFALLNLRWCAIAGFPICESADQSPWAKRLKLQ